MNTRRAAGLVVALFILIAPLAAQDKTPPLTTEQKLKLRDAQVATMAAQQAFSAFMQNIQKRVEELPEYQKLKAESEAAAKGWTLALTEIREQAQCPDCELNIEKLTLTRPAPKQAKADAPK